MTYGISTVFIFLGLLIAAMTIMSSVLRKYPAPNSALENTASNTTDNQLNSNNLPVDNNTLQVIQAAISEHRNQKSL